LFEIHSGLVVLYFEISPSSAIGFLITETMSEGAKNKLMKLLQIKEVIISLPSKSCLIVQINHREIESIV